MFNKKKWLSYEEYEYLVYNMERYLFTDANTKRSYENLINKMVIIK